MNVDNRAFEMAPEGEPHGRSQLPHRPVPRCHVFSRNLQARRHCTSVEQRAPLRWGHGRFEQRAAALLLGASLLQSPQRGAAAGSAWHTVCEGLCCTRRAALCMHVCIAHMGLLFIHGVALRTQKTPVLCTLSRGYLGGHPDGYPLGKLVSTLQARALKSSPRPNT